MGTIQSLAAWPEDKNRMGGPGEAPGDHDIEPEPIDVTDALNVLAQRYQFDRYGRNLPEIAVALKDNDFIHDISFDVLVELLKFVAANNCVALKQTHTYLVDALEGLEVPV